MKLTWKKEPRSSRVGAGPSDAILSLDGAEVARVSSLHVGGYDPVHQHGGWYWLCGANESRSIAYRNTHKKPIVDFDAAKSECEAYIRKCLGMPEKKR